MGSVGQKSRTSRSEQSRFCLLVWTKQAGMEGAMDHSPDQHTKMIAKWNKCLGSHVCVCVTLKNEAAGKRQVLADSNLSSRQMQQLTGVKDYISLLDTRHFAVVIHFESI